MAGRVNRDALNAACDMQKEAQATPDLPKIPDTGAPMPTTLSSTANPNPASSIDASPAPVISSLPSASASTPSASLTGPVPPIGSASAAPTTTSASLTGAVPPVGSESPNTATTPTATPPAPVSSDTSKPANPSTPAAPSFNYDLSNLSNGGYFANKQQYEKSMGANADWNAFHKAYAAKVDAAYKAEVGTVDRPGNPQRLQLLAQAYRFLSDQSGSTNAMGQAPQPPQPRGPAPAPAARNQPGVFASTAAAGGQKAIDARNQAAFNATAQTARELQSKQAPIDLNMRPVRGATAPLAAGVIKSIAASNPASAAPVARYDRPTAGAPGGKMKVNRIRDGGSYAFVDGEPMTWAELSAAVKSGRGDLFDAIPANLKSKLSPEALQEQDIAKAKALEMGKARGGAYQDLVEANKQRLVSDHARSTHGIPLTGEQKAKSDERAAQMASDQLETLDSQGNGSFRSGAYADISSRAHPDKSRNANPLEVEDQLKGQRHAANQAAGVANVDASLAMAAKDKQVASQRSSDSAAKSLLRQPDQSDNPHTQLPLEEAEKDAALSAGAVMPYRVAGGVPAAPKPQAGGVGANPLEAFNAEFGKTKSARDAVLGLSDEHLIGLVNMLYSMYSQFSGGQKPPVAPAAGAPQPPTAPTPTPAPTAPTPTPAPETTAVSPEAPVTPPATGNIVSNTRSHTGTNAPTGLEITAALSKDKRSAGYHVDSATGVPLPDPYRDSADSKKEMPETASGIPVKRPDMGGSDARPADGDDRRNVDWPRTGDSNRAFPNMSENPFKAASMERDLGDVQSDFADKMAAAMRPAGGGGGVPPAKSVAPLAAKTINTPLNQNTVKPVLNNVSGVSGSSGG